MYDEQQIGERLVRLFNLTGKTAIVTGSAQGLGRSTAALFAELGARVVLADLNANAAAKTAAEIDSRRDRVRERAWMYPAKRRSSRYSTRSTHNLAGWISS